MAMRIQYAIRSPLNGLIVLCSISSDIPFAAECFQVPTQVAAPRNGLIYSSRLSMASRLDPATVDFSSPERFILSVSRKAERQEAHTELNPKFDLKLLLKDAASGQLKEHCRVNNATLPNPFREIHYFVYSPDAVAEDWRAELIDHASETTGSQRPNPLTLEIRNFPNISLEHSDAYSEADAYRWVPTINLDCKQDPNPTATSPDSGPPQDAGDIGPASKTAIVYVRSVGPILVELETEPDARIQKSAVQTAYPLKSIPSIEVRASVKDDTPNSFSASCNPFHMASGDHPKERLTLQASTQYSAGRPLIWRVELHTPKDAKYRTKYSLRYPTDGTPKSITTFPSEFLCASPNPTRGVRTDSNEQTFAGATLLSVNIKDPERLLSASARETITRYLLVGMTLWRPVCYLCTPDHLVIANVDGKRYALDALVEALDNFYGGRVGSQSIQATASSKFPPNPWGTLAPRGGKYYPVLSAIDARHQPRAAPAPAHYVPVKLPTNGFIGLCRDNFNELPPWLQRIRLAWGCEDEIAKAPQMSNLKASTQLSFLTSPLDGCSTGPNTVACESSALRIEFNAKDYRFLSHPEGIQIVGNGMRNADLLHVLIHEIGHWIGIGHLNDLGSIMNESLSGSRCIDTAATHALNILASGGLYPVKTPQALLFEAPIESAPMSNRQRP